MGAKQTPLVVAGATCPPIRLRGVPVALRRAVGHIAAVEAESGEERRQTSLLLEGHALESLGDAGQDA